MIVTVFTPTYNRAYTLSKLYDSLCAQSSMNFEWLVVDDGSTDDTESMVAGFMAQDKLRIRYIRQENGGKHRAINRGVSEAQGELFFVVDSDDQLTPDAIDFISTQYSSIRGDESFAGLCALKSYFDGSKIGGEENWTQIDANALDIRFKHGVNGDLAEVLRRDVLQRYPFPDFEGERFCPEALVWNRIARDYKLRYIYKKIYLCDYLDDGLTARIVAVRMDSPTYSMTYYSELIRDRVPMRVKIKSAINFWRFAQCSAGVGFWSKVHRAGIWTLLFYPLGLMMNINDKRGRR